MDPNFSGIDTFTYKINEGSLDSDVALVTINVVGRNVNHSSVANAGPEGVEPG